MSYRLAAISMQRAPGGFLGFFLFLVLPACSLFASDEALLQTSDEDVGVAIKSVAVAIDNCDESVSMATIVRYGTDSRYYVIIRGWLVQRLNGVESRIPESSAADSSDANVRHADCLRNAIRRIDLE